MHEESANMYSVQPADTRLLLALAMHEVQQFGVHENHIHEAVPGFASVVAAVVALAQAGRQPQPIAAPCCCSAACSSHHRRCSSNCSIMAIV